MINITQLDSNGDSHDKTAWVYIDSLYIGNLDLDGDSWIFRTVPIRGLNSNRLRDMANAIDEFIKNKNFIESGVDHGHYF